MFEELLSGYLSPYLCLQNLFETRVLHNFWTCCVFWQAYDLSTHFAESQCGPESIQHMNQSFELAFPGIRAECPGYGSMTCTQWFLIPLFFIALGLLVCLLFIGWTLYVTYKYYQLIRQRVVYLFDETDTAEHQVRASKRNNNLNIQLDPSMLGAG